MRRAACGSTVRPSRASSECAAWRRRDCSRRHHHSVRLPPHRATKAAWMARRRSQPTGSCCALSAPGCHSGSRRADSAARRRSGCEASGPATWHVAWAPRRASEGAPCSSLASRNAMALSRSRRSRRGVRRTRAPVTRARVGWQVGRVEKCVGAGAVFSLTRGSHQLSAIGHRSSICNQRSAISHQHEAASHRRLAVVQKGSEGTRRDQKGSEGTRRDQKGSEGVGPSHRRLAVVLDAVDDVKEGEPLARI